MASIQQFHKLLKRQLSRLNLSENTLPDDLVKWQQLLSSVSKAYIESDQERYLLERSMEISSREMSELNQQLEDAQQLAELGYWFYDREKNKIIWSKELYDLFGLDYSNLVPSYDEVITLVIDTDRAHLMKVTDDAFQYGTNFDVEIQMKGFAQDSAYKWYRIIAHSIIENNKPITQLTGIVMDITKRKEAEQSLHSLNQQLLTSARRAGMADVATSILHNVGNILNSANVSVKMIKEKTESIHYEKIGQVLKMIQANQVNLADYFANDDKGKLIPSYLNEMIKTIAESNKEIIQEVGYVEEKLQHIKAITTFQKSLSGVSGVIEQVNLSDIINTATMMCDQSLHTKDIQIIKEYENNYSLMTDKSKLLQILINLIQNAKDAVLMKKNVSCKQITFTIKKISTDELQIMVADNGIGIIEENLIVIFSFGFTTKPNGHGFGLHSSALVAKELGGSLAVTSPGVNQGATFTLTLPFNYSLRGTDDEA